MKTIRILCPVYHEEEAIAGFHARLIAALKPIEARFDLGVVYAVDPSPDRTVSILQELSAKDSRVEVLVMSRRFGHQAALIAGMEAVTADALIMLDSDGQHPPELIPTLIEAWEGGAEIVQTLRKDGSETGRLKRWSSNLFYRLLNRIGSVILPPGAADFRLLSRRVLDVLRIEIRERNVFLRGLVAWVGFNIRYVEFVPQARALGQSKYRAGALFNFALAGITSFSKAPLRICIALGLSISAISLLIGLAQMVAYLVSDVTVPGWASLMAFISLVGGVQLLFLGLLGEYIGQIFDEVKGRPRYLLAHRYRGGQDLLAADSTAEKS